jgi:arginase
LIIINNIYIKQEFDMSMNFRKFIPIIAECHQGQKKPGVSLGGEYLYNNIFRKNTKLNPIIIPNKWFDSNVGYKSLYNICSTLEYPLTLGGDHSIGTSTVLASIQKYNYNVTVIWIDAHADINTMKSSLSKNRHGMPLASATNLDSCWFDESLNIKLNFDKIIYVGIRDLDPFEKQIIIKYKIKNYTPEQTINFINSTSDLIHISFDVDALEPKYLDSTGTVASNGLSYLEVKNIINASLIKNNLVGLDIVEFNPELGNVTKSLKTLEKLFL